MVYQAFVRRRTAYAQSNAATIMAAKSSMRNRRWIEHTFGNLCSEAAAERRRWLLDPSRMTERAGALMLALREDKSLE